MLKKVVFLDRDGVINKDSSDYIKSRQEFEFLPKSIEAIRNFTLNGFTVIIITNQSAINRGLTTLQEIMHIHEMMVETVKSRGGLIKDVFFCPHTPEEGCICRKPETGLIRKAQKKYNIDLACSAMVGDSVKDIECAKSAGCRYAVLVKTGNGKKSEKTLLKKIDLPNSLPDHVSRDLFDASHWIINRFDRHFS